MKERKPLKIIISCVVALILTCGVFFAGFFVGRIKDPDLAALEFFLQYYKDYYYEVEDDYIGLMTDAVLDDYSEYYSAEEYDAIKKGAKGIRGGIGVVFYSVGGKIFVYSVSGNSPAERAGLCGGEEVEAIKAIGEDEFTFVSTTTALGDEISSFGLGEEFILLIKSGGEEKEITLAKKEYVETYVLYADDGGKYRYTDDGGKMHCERYADCLDFDADTAYLKYKSFNGNGSGLNASSEQIGDVLDRFKASSKKKFILDLRDNGGGYMDICSSVAAYFVGADNGTKPLIAVAEDNKGKKENFKSEKVKFNNYGFESIVVLANSSSASASEVLIGAMLDYDSKGIVKVVLENSGGEYRTYGKGIMQTTYPNLLGGGAVKLTTAKLYWSSGISIHGVGVTKSSVSDVGYSEKIYEPETAIGDYALDFAKTL